MNRGSFFSLFLVILFQTSPLAAQTAYFHHDLSVTVSPVEHRITVVDTVTVPKEIPGEVRFRLHSGLKPASTTPRVSIIKQADERGPVPLESYQVKLPRDLRAFVIT